MMKTKIATRAPAAARPANTILRRRVLPMLIAGCFGSGAAFANPVGPQVINGQVGFSNQGNVLSITNTPGTIINWQSFSINPGELTRFIQQNPNSAVLNRILGQDPSVILGALQSNGRVFLVNPNGVLFGQGAQVDVNGLVASTLAISNEDFLNGKLNFKAGNQAGKLQNQGSITTPTGGQVYLIAPQVENSGIITSPKGEILLAAGHTVQLVDSANPELHVVLSAPEHQALNLGQIIAQGGKAGIYGALIKQRGVVSANSAVVGENGKIVFKATKDTLLEAGSVTTATSAGKGGEIQILGERVGLTGDAKVDASGRQGGGTILVGGDYQGKNPLIRNASAAYVGSDASLKADALDSGDGGKIIVWANEATQFYGSLFARGGTNGGDGGFAETSGKHHLDFRGHADLRSPQGKAGTLLLDPDSIVIGAGATDVSGSPIFDNLAGGSAINASALSALLDAGNNVSITATEHITVAQAVSWSQNKSLSLTAAGDIAINQPLTASGAGSSITLTADGNITQTAAITAPALHATSNKASITLNSNNAVGTFFGTASTGLSFTNGATDLIVGGLSVNTGDATITSGADLTVSGWNSWSNAKRTLTATGDIMLNASVNGAAGSDLILHTTAGNITQGAELGVSNLTAHADVGSITLDHSYNKIAAITSSSAGKSFTVNNAQSITLDAVSATNNLSVAATGASDIALAGAVASTSGSVSLTAGNNLSLNAAVNAGSAVTLTAGNDASIGSVDATLGNISVSAEHDVTATGTLHSGNGQVSLNASNNLATSGEINAAAGVSLNASAGSVAIGAPVGVTDSGKSISISAGTIVGINGGLTTPNGAVNMHGDSVGLSGAATAINAGDANVSIEALGNSGITMGSGTQISVGGSNAAINLKANSMNLGSLLASGNGTVAIAPYSSNYNIEFIGPGTNKSVGKLQLKQSDLDGINANKLSFTTLGTSEIRVSDPIALSSVSNLELNSNAVVIDKSLSVTPANSRIDLTAGIVSVGSAGSVNTNGANGAITFNTDSLNLQGVEGSIKAGAGAIVVAPTSNTGVLEIGAADIGAMRLTNSELRTFSSSGSVTIGVPSKGWAGDIATGGNVDLSGSQLTGKLTLAAGAMATTTIGHSITTAGDLSLSGLHMVLGSGTINAGSHKVTLNSNADFDLGSGTDLSGTAMEVSEAELNKITAATIEAHAGGTLTVTTAITPTHASTLTLGGESVSQNSGGVLTVNNLAIKSFGNVALDQAANMIGNVAASVGDGELVNSNIAIKNGKALNIGNNIDGFSGISVYTGTGNYSAASPKNVIALKASGDLTQSAGALLSGKAVYAEGTSVLLNNANPTGVIAGKATGSTGVFSYASSNGISVDTVGGFAGVQNTSTTAAVGIDLTGTAIGQNVAVSTSTGLSLHTAGAVAMGGITNSVSAISATTPISLAFKNSGSLTVGINGNGITTGNGLVDLLSVSGGLNIAAPINTGSGDVALTTAGTITSGTSGSITGNFLNMTAGGGIQVKSQVSGIGASNSGANTPIEISNTGSLSIYNVQQTGGTGHIVIQNVGATTMEAGHSVTTSSGDISIAAHSPLTINGTVSSATGAISLEAGSSGSTADKLIISAGATVNTSGSISLKAGDTITVAGTVGAQATKLANQNPVTNAGPTLNDCVANPSLAGCAAVLPTVAQCTTAPTTTGCSVVLPTLEVCTTTPTTPGCTAILPTLAQCTTAPATSGCSAVLPTLAQCTVTPTADGCSAVLPTLAQCTTAPTTSGCSAVLPTLAQCTTTPTSPGCTAVLPTVAQCTTTPNADGCSAVLPTLAQCTTTPTTPGCTAVLPTLAQCTTAPATPGCTAVLPTLAQCTTAPTTSGCAAVLPTLAQCSAAPTTTGCTVVLPTLAQCTTAPATSGCTVVLPSLAQCTTAPNADGCSAVLPTLAQCTVAPATPGCTTVLPTAAQCTTAPTTPGCSVILPSLAQCMTTPTASGCSVVLPTLAQCTATPTLAGCSVVLPTGSQCAAAPALPACLTIVPPQKDEPVVLVTQLLSSTVTTLTNTSLNVLPANRPPAGNPSGGPQNPTGGGAGNKPEEQKTEGKKEEKKDAPGAKDDGVKKNEPIKKLYCN